MLFVKQSNCIIFNLLKPMRGCEAIIGLFLDVFWPLYL